MRNIVRNQKTQFCISSRDCARRYICHVMTISESLEVQEMLNSSGYDEGIELVHSGLVLPNAIEGFCVRDSRVSDKDGALQEFETPTESAVGKSRLGALEAAVARNAHPETRVGGELLMHNIERGQPCMTSADCNYDNICHPMTTVERNRFAENNGAEEISQSVYEDVVEKKTIRLQDYGEVQLTDVEGVCVGLKGAEYEVQGADIVWA